MIAVFLRYQVVVDKVFRLSFVYAQSRRRRPVTVVLVRSFAVEFYAVEFGAALREKIVIPQAVKNILPTLGNEFIALIKETSVVSFVGAADLYVAFNYIGTNNYEFMVPYLVMALIYIVIVLVITLLVKLLERSLKKSDRRN